MHDLTSRIIADTHPERDYDDQRLEGVEDATFHVYRFNSAFESFVS
jgi:hypothetical protein